MMPKRSAVEPALVRQPAATPIACMRLMPESEMTSVETMKMLKNRKKNDRMRPTIFIGTGSPSILMLTTMCGCRVWRTSVTPMRMSTSRRMTLRPPPALPMQPPTKTSTKSTRREKSGQSQHGAETKPPVDRKAAVWNRP